MTAISRRSRDRREPTETTLGVIQMVFPHENCLGLNLTVNIVACAQKGIKGIKMLKQSYYYIFYIHHVKYFLSART